MTWLGDQYFQWSSCCVKMGVGHGGRLLGVSWSCFSKYQKSYHVLLLAQVVRFQVESTENIYAKFKRVRNTKDVLAL